MDVGQYLEREWRPALACAEPAGTALAAATAAAKGWSATGTVARV